jgi:hypothetical protein
MLTFLLLQEAVAVVRLVVVLVAIVHLRTFL